MVGRPFLLIFLAMYVTTSRNWHLPHRTSRSAGGLPGLQRAVPSAPLDERYGTGRGALRAFVPPYHPGMRGSLALFKTVTDEGAR
jgi:hypothetical protein